MPEFVSTNKCFFVLWKRLIYVNDIIPLKILIKSTDSTLKGSEYHDGIQTADNIKRISWSDAYAPAH